MISVSQEYNQYITYTLALDYTRSIYRLYTGYI